MNRTLFFISLLILAFTIQLSSANVKEKMESAECIKCHHQIYKNALASPYQHTVVINRCNECHITRIMDDKDQGEKEEESQEVIHFSTYQTEGILSLEDLQDDQSYTFEIVATDKAEQRSKPDHMNIVPGKAEEFEGDVPELTQLSALTVDEIKKGVFAEATISWVTDVPATSEVEYKLFNRKGSRFELKHQFSRKHRVTLNGLRHDQYYFYRVISRDMKGNVMESDENIFDTSDEIAGHKGLTEEVSADPVINEVRAFRIKGQKGMYLKIHTNEPAQFTVSFNRMPPKEITDRETDRNHSSGLAPARYAAIDACKKCHNQNASHPVGVRAQDDKIRTPEDLPTIEGGIVTCVSCHFPHGGKQLFFARTDFNKDLCIKCHKGYY